MYILLAENYHLGTMVDEFDDVVNILVDLDLSASSSEIPYYSGIVWFTGDYDNEPFSGGNSLNDSISQIQSIVNKHRSMLVDPDKIYARLNDLRKRVASSGTDKPLVSN